MRIMLIALGMLVSMTAAQAQLIGPADTPESIAAVRSECAYQPDPARCNAYLDHYTQMNRGWKQIRSTFNSGFQHGGPVPQPHIRYYRPPQVVVQPVPVYCIYRGHRVLCR